jgi:hypothetical protein
MDESFFDAPPEDGDAEEDAAPRRRRSSGSQRGSIPPKIMLNDGDESADGSRRGSNVSTMRFRENESEFTRGLREMSENIGAAGAGARASGLDDHF